MALIECYECGKEISSMAAACPNCGAPARIIYVENEDEIYIEGNIYRDVIIDGKKVKKWFGLKSIIDFSSDGKPIHKIEKTFFNEIDRSKIDTNGITQINNLKKAIRELTSDTEYWYEYDDRGDLIFEHNSLGERFEYNYQYDKSGNKASRTEYKKTLLENETITRRYKYNNCGRLLSEKIDKGLFNSDITEYEYDDKGNIVMAKTNDNVKWLYENDEKGNPIYAKCYSLNNENEWWALYEYEYWKNGNLKKQIEYRTPY